MSSSSNSSSKNINIDELPLTPLCKNILHEYVKTGEDRPPWLAWLRPNIKLVPVNVSSGKETTVKYKLIGNFSKETLDGFIVKPEETDDDYKEV